MKLLDLRYLCGIEETGSFSKTAEIFMVSQPVVSIAIKKLEAEVSTKIVFREKFSGNIKLTSCGKEMLKFFKRVSNEVEDLKKSFQLEDDDYFFVGIKNNEVDLLLRDKICDIRIKKNNPNKEIKFFHGDEKLLNRALIAKKLKVKISISNNIHENNSTFEKKIIKVLNFSIIKSVDYKKQVKDINDLKNITVIAVEGSFQTEKLHELLAINNVKVKEIIYVKSLSLARILIEEGKGVGIFLSDVLGKSNNLISIETSYKMFLCLEYILKDAYNQIRDMFDLAKL